ncbi:hypothetical protein MF406_17790 [Georgenia sp. TF02-10]|uniref:variant leucine-rich repeat-containing protein n=1 Tax=Georgenia sp. TF02-10 TaxID=2917725 RepID=UPI001FA6D1FB|nr:hypothetical protein [Georgenia sp. TF02-10]UNX54701.1 hypothetical protein MF406_17790 [Georgenia sp. TF02-10]
MADDSDLARQAADPATPLTTLQHLAQHHPELRPAIAANPSTYPALLEWLGDLGVPEVDAALAARRAPQGSVTVERIPTAERLRRQAEAGRAQRGRPVSRGASPAAGSVAAGTTAAQPASAQQTSAPPTAAGTDSAQPAPSVAPAGATPGQGVAATSGSEAAAEPDGEPATRTDSGPHAAQPGPAATELDAGPPSSASSATARPERAQPESGRPGRPPVFTPATPRSERPTAARPTESPTEVFRAVQAGDRADAAPADAASGDAPTTTSPTRTSAAAAAAATPRWAGVRREPAAPTSAAPTTVGAAVGASARQATAPAANAPAANTPGAPTADAPTRDAPTGPTGNGPGRRALLALLAVVGVLVLVIVVWALTDRTADDPTATPTGDAQGTTKAAPETGAAEEPADPAAALAALPESSSCSDPAADAAVLTGFAGQAAEGGQWADPADGQRVIDALTGLQQSCSPVHAVAVSDAAAADPGAPEALRTTLTTTTDWVELARPAPPGAEERTSFATPSGNIACTLGGTTSCTISDVGFEPPAGCTGSVTLVVGLVDEARADCAAPAATGDGTLEYGQAATAGRFACTSEESGVTCWSTLTGRGFSVARAGIETF